MLRAILLFLTLLSHGKKSFKFLFNISRINRSSSGILSARPSAVPSCRTFLFFLQRPGIILFSFCLSLRIRYASPIFLNRSSARLSPGCVSGWHSLPLFYMPFLWCPHQPFAKPLIHDMDSYLFQPFIHGNRKPVKCAFYCRFKAQAVLFADNLRPAVMLNNFLLPLQKRFCLSSV